MDEVTKVRELAAPFELELTSQDIDRLGRFLDLLHSANQRMNLTRIVEREEAWNRHILDSLTLMPFIEAAGATNLIDIGSGGGLPGIPLAVTMSELPITLLEATGKKAHYLSETATELGLEHVTVLAERAESLGTPDGGGRGAWDVVTARAVGGLPVLLELALPLLVDGGVLLAIKGQRAAEEIEASRKALKTLGGTVELTHRTPTGTIVAIRRTGPMPRMYPRRPGEPARAPIGGVPRDQR
ncbi:MAG: 16S rRNA (guanine(527)-N(7))-methyltransferase RsmG [Planctomycetes bacterium]|nr:16S rRNA (guanine(527)-N(7))-methyltransferase RsmG [Planctomycetota bacterium]